MKVKYLGGCKRITVRDRRTSASYSFERDGDEVEVPDELGKELLERKGGHKFTLTSTTTKVRRSKPQDGETEE